MQSTKNGSTSEYNNKNFITLVRVIKLHDTDKESVCLAQISQSSRPYFSMVKMLLGLVALMLGHCIFKTKHAACKITITGLGCFFDLKQYATFFYCPTDAVKSVVTARACVDP